MQTTRTDLNFPADFKGPLAVAALIGVCVVAGVIVNATLGLGALAYAALVAVVACRLGHRMGAKAEAKRHDDPELIDRRNFVPIVDRLAEVEQELEQVQRDLREAKALNAAMTDSIDPSDFLVSDDDSR